MDKELQVYYEEMFSTMATQGWSLLMEDFQALKATLNDLSTLPQGNYFLQIVEKKQVFLGKVVKK